MFAKNLARQNFEHLIPQFRLFKKLICVKDTPFMLNFEEFSHTSASFFSKKKKNFRKRSKIEMFVCFFNNCPAHQVHPEIYKEGKKDLHFLDRRSIEISYAFFL